MFLYQPGIFWPSTWKDIVSVDVYQVFRDFKERRIFVESHWHYDIILIFFCSIKYLSESLPFLNLICCVSSSSLLQRRLVNSESIDVIWIASHLFVSNHVKKYLIEVINHGKIREKTVKVYWIMNVLIFGFWMKSM